jgi:glycosyltransferase involved in cell wall biosynthesis
MTASPRVVIGAPLYGQARHVGEAVRSLLAQTYGDFALVLVDDGSPDDTVATVRDAAGDDPRVELVVNPRRQGMLVNTNRAYALARERHPQAEFFALASDHDVWDPRFLERLVGALDARPRAVLAYPLTERIDALGRVVSGSWRFTTEGVRDPRERLRRGLRRMVSGDMVYGLFRASALPPGRLYAPVLAPDRQLLAELALRGEFVQVEERLWRRRFVGLASLERQRQAFWPAGEAPRSARAPWWTVHTALAAREHGPAFAARDYLPASVAFQLRTRALGVRNALLVAPLRRLITSEAGRRTVRARVLPALRETREVLVRLAADEERRT